MRILYLEDSLADADLARRALSRATPGHVIEVVPTLAMARERLASAQDFDLALLDLRLPDGSGLEILAEIRERNMPLAVVVLTGSGDQDSAIAALKAGVDDYLVKREGYLDRLPQTLTDALAHYRRRTSRRPHTLHVLYAEHNAFDIDLARKHLARHAPHIVLDVVTTAGDVLARLPVNSDTSSNYQVVLLDYRLPDLDAIELMKQLRQERGLNLPIVLVTGHGSEEVAAQAMRLGADDYLTKHSGYLYELPAVLEKVCRQAEMERDQAALEESEARQRLILESAAEAIYGMDLEGNCTFVNPAFLRVLGYDAPSELLGKSIHALIHHSHAEGPHFPVEDCPIYRAFRDGAACHSDQEVFWRRDGSAVPVEYWSHPMYRGGKVVGAVATFFDISQRRQAEARLKLQGAALEATANAIVITDREAIIEWANPAFTNLTGFGLEEALGKRPKDLVRSGLQSPEFYKAMWDTILTGQVWHGEVVNKRKDGSLYHEDLTITPVRDGAGEISHFIAVKQDISERKQHQQLQQVRSSVLDRIIAKEPLSIILDEIAHQLESLRPDLMVSIMRMDADGRLRRGAAPTLPDYYHAALDGLVPGEGTGSCGTAAWRGEPVIVEDVQTDPQCAPYREIAAEAGFRACWSYPFKDEANQVLGTLAVHYRVPRTPTPADQELITEFARLAGLAVQRVQEESARQLAELELRQREQALDMAAQSALELLRASDLDVAVGQVLEMLGEKTGADRVYIFENRTGAASGEVFTSQRYEWTKTGVSVQIDNPDLQEIPFGRDFARWLDLLAAGEVVKGRVRDFPATERAILEPQEIVSLLVVPIGLHEQLWGFLGFDAVQGEREWSAAEESVLRIVAASLGAAIQRKQSMTALRQAATVFESTREGVVITNLEPRILAVNPAYTEITGYSEAEVLGRNPGHVRSGRHDADYYRAMWAQLRASGHWQGEIWNRHKDGYVFPQLLNIGTVRDDDGKPTGYVGVMTDISQIKQSQERLEHLAHYDPLTDLPNRLLVSSRLEHALLVAERNQDRVAVLFIDLDQFKTVNDSLGHDVGDELLVAVAERLAARLRDEDTFGRLGGDEFVILIERIGEAQDAAVVARDMIETLQEPFRLDSGHEVYIQASIGISLFPDDGESAADLIRNADAAMYRAKREGRNTFGFYTEDLTQAASVRLKLETRLRQALERQEFVLHYQPLESLADGRVVGAEALVRWQPPDGPLVPPSEFIPLAEDTGLIVPLGEWVLATACRQAKAWLDAGLTLETMAVNMSARQFQRADIDHCLGEFLAETGLPPGCLELEITETGIMEQGERAVQALGAMRSRGVRLAIDDFGTGYSSLAYLKRLPLDKLKIDRSFVNDLPHDPNDTAISVAIIAMARALGLHVLAEGVETQAQRDFLKEQGCDYCQGYLLSPPVPAEEFAARFLKK